MPAASATHKDSPPSTRRARPSSCEIPVGVLGCSNSADGSPPTDTGTRSRCRAGKPAVVSAARSSASTPKAIWACRTTGVAARDLKFCRSVGAKSRIIVSTTTAAVTPTNMAPSQYASRLRMGRGREIRSRVTPRRTGSVAIISASTSTVPIRKPPSGRRSPPEDQQRWPRLPRVWSSGWRLRGPCRHILA